MATEPRAHLQDIGQKLGEFKAARQQPPESFKPDEVLDKAKTFQEAVTALFTHEDSLVRTVVGGLARDMQEAETVYKQCQRETGDVEQLRRTLEGLETRYQALQERLAEVVAMIPEPGKAAEPAAGGEPAPAAAGAEPPEPAAAPEAGPQRERSRANFQFGETVYVRNRDNSVTRVVVASVVELDNGFVDLVVTDGDTARTFDQDGRTRKGLIEVSKKAPRGGVRLQTEFRGGESMQVDGQEIQRGDVLGYTKEGGGEIDVAVVRINRKARLIVVAELDDSGTPTSTRHVIPTSKLVSFKERPDQGADAALVAHIQTVEKGVDFQLPFSVGDTVYIEPDREEGESGSYHEVQVADVISIPYGETSDEEIVERVMVVVKDKHGARAYLPEKICTQEQLPLQASVSKELYEKDRTPLRSGGIEFTADGDQYIRAQKSDGDYGAVFKVVDVDRRHRYIEAIPLDRKGQPQPDKWKRFFERDFEKIDLHVTDQAGKRLDAPAQPTPAAEPRPGARPDVKGTAPDETFEQFKTRVQPGDRFVLMRPGPDGRVAPFWFFVDGFNADDSIKAKMISGGAEQSVKLDQWKKLEEMGGILPALSGNFERFVASLAKDMSLNLVIFKEEGGEVQVGNATVTVGEITPPPDVSVVLNGPPGGLEELYFDATNWQMFLDRGWIVTTQEQKDDINRVLKEGLRPPEPARPEPTPRAADADDDVVDAEFVEEDEEAERQKRFEGFKREYSLRTIVHIKHGGEEGMYRIASFDDAQKTAELQPVRGATTPLTLTMERLADIQASSASELRRVMVGDYGQFVQGLGKGDKIFIHYSDGTNDELSVDEITGSGASIEVSVEGGIISKLDRQYWEDAVDSGVFFEYTKAPKTVEQEDNTLIFQIEGNAVAKGQTLYAKRKGETNHSEWTVDKFTKHGAEEFITLKHGAEELKLKRADWSTWVRRGWILAESPAVAAAPPHAAGGPPPDPAAEAARLAAAEAARQAAERERRFRAEFVTFVQDIAAGYTVKVTDAHGSHDLKVERIEGDGEARLIYLEGGRQPLDVQYFIRRREQNVQFEKTPPAASSPPPDPAEAARQAAEAARLAREQQEAVFKTEFVSFVQAMAKGDTVRTTANGSTREFKVERVEGDGETRQIFFENQRRALDVQAFVSGRGRGAVYERVSAAAPQPAAVVQPTRGGGPETPAQREARLKGEFITFTQDIAKGYTLRIKKPGQPDEEFVVEKVEGKNEKRRITLEGQSQQFDVQRHKELVENENATFEKVPPVAASGAPTPTTPETADQRRERMKQEFTQLAGGLIPGQGLRETTRGEEFIVQRVSGSGDAAVIHLIPRVGIPTPVEWNLQKYTRMREQGRTFEAQQLSEDKRKELKYRGPFDTLIGNVDTGDSFVATAGSTKIIFEVVGTQPDALRVKMRLFGQAQAAPGEYDFAFDDFAERSDDGYTFELSGAEGKNLEDYPVGKYRYESAPGVMEEIQVIAHQDGKLLCENSNGFVRSFSPEEFGFLRTVSIDKEKQEREQWKAEFVQLVDGLKPNTYIKMTDADGDVTMIWVRAVTGAQENTVLTATNIDGTDPTDIHLADVLLLRSAGSKFERVAETPEQISVKEILEIIGKDELKGWYKHVAEKMGDNDYEGRATQLKDHLIHAFEHASGWPQDKRDKLETALRRKGYVGVDQADLFHQFEQEWQTTCVDAVVHTLILMAQHNVEARMLSDHEVKHYEEQQAQKRHADAQGNVVSRFFRGVGKRKWQVAATTTAGFAGSLLAGPMVGYMAANVVNRGFKRREGLKERIDKKHVYEEARDRVVEEVGDETQSAERLAAMISLAISEGRANGAVTTHDLYGTVLKRMKEAATSNEERNGYALEQLVWEEDVWLEGKKPKLEITQRIVSTSDKMRKFLSDLIERTKELVTSENHLYDESKKKYLYGEICSTAIAGIIGSSLELIVDAGAAARIATRAGIGATRGVVEQAGVKFGKQEQQRTEQLLHHLVESLDKNAQQFEAAVQHVQHEEHQAHDTKGRRRLWSSVKSGVMRGGLMAAIAGAVEGGRQVAANRTEVWNWMRSLVGLGPSESGGHRFGDEMDQQAQAPAQEELSPVWTQKDIDEVNASRGAAPGEAAGPGTQTEARAAGAAAPEGRVEAPRGVPLTESEQHQIRLGDFEWGPPHTDGKGFLHMANQLERDPEFKELIIERERAAFPDIKSDATALHHFRVRIAEEGGYNWRTGTYDKVPLKGVTYSVGANEKGAITIQADKDHLRSLGGRSIRFGEPAGEAHGVALRVRPEGIRVEESPVEGAKHFMVDDGKGHTYDFQARDAHLIPDMPGMIEIIDLDGNTVQRALNSFAMSMEVTGGVGNVALEGAGGGGINAALETGAFGKSGAVASEVGGGAPKASTRTVGGVATRGEGRGAQSESRAAEPRTARALRDRLAREAAAAESAPAPHDSVFRGFLSGDPAVRVVGDNVYYAKGAILNGGRMVAFLYDDHGTRVGFIGADMKAHIHEPHGEGWPKGLPASIQITDGAREVAARQLEAAERAGVPVEAPVATEPKHVTLADGGRAEFRYSQTGKVADIIRFGGHEMSRADVANAFFVDNAHYGGGAVPKPVEGGMINLGSYYQIYERLQETGQGSSPEAQFVRDKIHRIMNQVARVDGGKSVDEVYKPSILKEFGFFSGSESQERVLTNWASVEKMIDNMEHATRPQNIELTNLVRLVNMREGIFGPQGEGVASFVSRHAAELRLDPQTAATLARELPGQIAEMKRAVVEGISQGKPPEQIAAAVRRLDTFGDFNQNAAFFGAGGEIRTDASVVGQYEKLAVKVLKRLSGALAQN